MVLPKRCFIRHSSQSAFRFVLIFTILLPTISPASSDSRLSSIDSNRCWKFCDCRPISKDSSPKSSPLDVGFEAKCNFRSIDSRKLDARIFDGGFPKERVEIMNLTSNGIKTLSPGIFEGFDRLRILDLSSNKLETVQAEWFQGIEKLEQLFLENNRIHFIPERSLESLANLKWIDISSPFLTCDCNMKWFRRWISRGKEKADSKRNNMRRGSRITVTDSSVCQFPAKLRGRPFVEINRKSLICPGELDPATFTVHPSRARYAVQGGNVSLLCNVSTMKDNEILEWLHEGRPISTESMHDYAELENYFVDGGRFHVSRLRLLEITKQSEGEYACRLETPKGSTLKSVVIVTLGDNSTSQVCPGDIISSNKGVFLWPSTSISSISTIPCPHQRPLDQTAQSSDEIDQSNTDQPSIEIDSQSTDQPSRENIDRPINATRYCDENARWSEPITDQCDYRSSVYRELIDLLSASRLLSKSNADQSQESIRILESLNNLTARIDGDRETEKSIEEEFGEDETNMVLHLVEKFALDATDEEERLILEVINGLLKLNQKVLERADEKYRTGRRLLNILRSSSVETSQSEFSIGDCSVSSERESIRINYYGYSRTGSLRCMGSLDHEWIDETPQFTMDLLLDSSQPALPSAAPKLHIPLRFIYYSKATSLSQLVNMTSDESSDHQNVTASEWSIHESSAIAMISNRFAQFGQSAAGNSNDSNYMRLKWKLNKRKVPREFKLVQLVTDYKAGSLHWIPMDDCWSMTSSTNAYSGRSIGATCPITLGVFTVIVRKESTADRSGDWTLSKVPWVLACNGFALACIIYTVVVYIRWHSVINISVKLHHALVNCWISVATLIAVYSMGIDQTGAETVCMVVAIVLHYITLSVVIWFFLVVRTLHRKLHKLVHPKKLDNSSDDEDMMPYSDANPKPRHGPLVGMYFLAWGLPAMPCAFTLPLRMDSYTTNSRICYMEPNLIAFVALAIPTTAILSITFVLLIKAFRLQTRLEQRRDEDDTRIDQSILPGDRSIDFLGESTVGVGNRTAGGHGRPDVQLGDRSADMGDQTGEQHGNRSVDETGDQSHIPLNDRSAAPIGNQNGDRSNNETIDEYRDQPRDRSLAQIDDPSLLRPTNQSMLIQSRSVAVQNHRRPSVQPANDDAYSSISTKIGDCNWGGARSHLRSMGSILILITIVYGISWAFLIRPWIWIIDITDDEDQQVESYVLWAISGLQSILAVAIGLILISTYVFRKWRTLIRAIRMMKMAKNDRDTNGRKNRSGDGRSRGRAGPPRQPGGRFGDRSQADGPVGDERIVPDRSADRPRRRHHRPSRDQHDRSSRNQSITCAPTAPDQSMDQSQLTIDRYVNVPVKVSLNPSEDRPNVDRSAVVMDQSIVSVDPIDNSNRRHAGTTMTRPTSQQSGTIAPSVSNISTSRSQKIQQAVARKYYEKQRAMKSIDQEDDGHRSEKSINGDDDRIGEKMEKSGNSKSENGRITNGDSSDHHAKSNGHHHQYESKPKDRRPSVELYRKPQHLQNRDQSEATSPLATATKLTIRAVKNGGPVSSTMAASYSDEDSAPEALRTNSTVDEGRMKISPRVGEENTNETSV